MRAQQTNVSTGTVTQTVCNYKMPERFIYRRELIFLLPLTRIYCSRKTNTMVQTESLTVTWFQPVPGCGTAIPTYTQHGRRAQSPKDGSLLTLVPPAYAGKYMDESNLQLAVKTTLNLI